MSARGTIERREDAIQTRQRPSPGIGFQPQAEKGLSLGYPTLDEAGKVPTEQIPAIGTPLLSDDSATFAKFQNINTDTLIGRATAGVGDPEEIALTPAGRALIDDATAALQRTTLGLGTLATKNSVVTGDLDNDAVTYPKIQNVSATDKVLGRSTAGAGDVEEIAMTAAGRALVDDATAAAQRTTLGLGTGAVKDYDEGTFSPTVRFAGASTGITYSINEGSWVKQGNLVVVQLQITLTNKGSSVGAASIGNLPFSSWGGGGSANRARSYPSVGYFGNFAAGVTWIGGILTDAATAVDLFKSGAGSAAAMADTDFTNTSDIRLTISYRTA